jgi:hypothetical protein
MALTIEDIERIPFQGTTSPSSSDTAKKVAGSVVTIPVNVTGTDNRTGMSSVPSNPNVSTSSGSGSSSSGSSSRRNRSSSSSSSSSGGGASGRTDNTSAVVTPNTTATGEPPVNYISPIQTTPTIFIRGSNILLLPTSKQLDFLSTRIVGTDVAGNPVTAREIFEEAKKASPVIPGINRIKWAEKRLLSTGVTTPDIPSTTYKKDFWYNPNDIDYVTAKTDMETKIEEGTATLNELIAFKKQFPQWQKEYIENTKAYEEGIKTIQSSKPTDKFWIDVNKDNKQTFHQMFVRDDALKEFQKQRTITEEGQYKGKTIDEWFADASKSYSTVNQDISAMRKNLVDISSGKNILTSYETAGYELDISKEGGYSFKTPKATDVVEYYYGNRPDLYVAQSARTLGLGTLVSAVQQTLPFYVQDVAQGKYNILEEHKQALAEGILGSTRKQNEDVLSYAGRFWTSPEVIMDVYVPLATLGISKAITVVGRAASQTLLAARIGSALAPTVSTGSKTVTWGGAFLKAGGKILTTKSGQALIVGSIYTTTEAPTLIETYQVNPSRFGTVFGQSIARYSTATTAAYVGSTETAFTRKVSEQLVGGWQTTKDILRESFPKTYTTFSGLSTKMNTMVNSKMFKDVFVTTGTSIPLPGVQQGGVGGVMRTPTIQSRMTTPTFNVGKKVSPNIIGVDDVYPQGLINIGKRATIEDISVYPYSGGFKGVNIESGYPSIEFSGFLVTAKKPVFIKNIVDPRTGINYANVLVGPKYSFSFGKSTTQYLIKGKIVQPGTKTSMFGIGSSNKQLIRQKLGVFEFEPYETRMTTGSFYGYSQEGNIAKSAYLKKYARNLLPEPNTQYSFLKTDMKVVQGGKSYPVSGITEARTSVGLSTEKITGVTTGKIKDIKVNITDDTMFGRISVNEAKVKMRIAGKDTTSISEGSLTKYEFVGELEGLTDKQGNFVKTILREKGTGTSPYKMPVKGAPVSDVELVTKKLSVGGKIIDTDLSKTKIVIGENKILLKTDKNIIGIKPVTINDISTRTSTLTINKPVSQTISAEAKIQQQLYGITSSLAEISSKQITPILTRTTTTSLLRTTSLTSGLLTRNILEPKTIYKQIQEPMYDISTESISENLLINKNIFDMDFEKISDTMNIQKISQERLTQNKLIQDRMLGEKTVQEKVTQEKQVQAKLLEQKQVMVLDRLLMGEMAFTPPPTIPRPPTIIPPILPSNEEELFGRKQPKQKETGQGYNVYVKERSMYQGKVRKPTRFIKMSKHPLIESDALAYGGHITDNTSAISFKIKPTKSKAQRPTTMVKPWETIKHKYTRKGEIWIEQNPYRIDTPGEKQGVSALGWQSNRIKGIKNNLFGNNKNSLFGEKNMFNNNKKKIGKGGKRVRYF